MKLLTLLSLLFSFSAAQASRALIKNYQSFYQSDSLTSYLLIPTLMDIGKDQILIESGATMATSVTNGAAFVGQIALKENWLALVSLGEQNDLVGSARVRFNSENSKTYRLMQNPLNLFVAHKFWGQSVAVGVSRSEFKDKLTTDLEKAFVTTVGYRFGLFHLDFHWATVDQVKTAVGDELNIEQPLQVIGLYELDSAELAMKYDSYFQKQKINSIENASEDRQIVQISYFDMSKIQDIQFNYRLEYYSQSIKNKITNEVNRINYFPITLGFQSGITDWLNVIGTVKQPLFINQGSGVLHSDNATTVQVGSEFKYKDAQINALLGGLSGPTAGGNIDGSSLLSQVSLSYKF